MDEVAEEEDDKKSVSMESAAVGVGQSIDRNEVEQGDDTTVEAAERREFEGENVVVMGASASEPEDEDSEEIANVEGAVEEGGAFESGPSDSDDAMRPPIDDTNVAEGENAMDDEPSPPELTDEMAAIDSKAQSADDDVEMSSTMADRSETPASSQDKELDDTDKVEEANVELNDEIEEPIETISEEPGVSVAEKPLSVDTDVILKSRESKETETPDAIVKEATKTEAVPTSETDELLVEREASFDDETDLSVSIVTWNLAEESPSEEDASFIKRFRKHGDERENGSDIVLISGQECENIKPRRTEGRRSREYRRLMIKMLGKEYVPLALHLLGGIQFGLFCKRSLLADMEHVSVADVTCGIGNVFHNKGAIAAFVTLKAKPESGRAKSLRMLFVTTHMAAHVKNTAARNSDFWRIASELEAQAPPRFLTPKPIKDGESTTTGSYLLESMDRIFFCGDLNYRLDLPREFVEHSVAEMARDPHHASAWRHPLLRHDQLRAVMAEELAFPGFAEGPILFPPTFKFDKDDESDSYDTSHKQRIPAWTDRILFKSAAAGSNSCTTRVLEYDSVRKARHSDHRPVYATLRVSRRGRRTIPKQKKKKKPKKKSGTKKRSKTDR